MNVRLQTLEEARFRKATERWFSGQRTTFPHYWDFDISEQRANDIRRDVRHTAERIRNRNQLPDWPAGCKA